MQLNNNHLSIPRIPSPSLSPSTHQHTFSATSFNSRILPSAQSLESLGSRLNTPRQLLSDLTSATTRVNVFARFRPLDRDRLHNNQRQEKQIIQIVNDCTVRVKSVEESVYTLNKVFGPEVEQKTVFNQVAKNIVSDLARGISGTVLAYGQTGSGKTHTMFGGPDTKNAGIIPRSITQIFESMKAQNQLSSSRITLKCSILEIYKETLRDLLMIGGESSRKELKIKQTTDQGLIVVALTEHPIASETQLLLLLELGSKNRKISTTNVNERSSRSHTIFKLTVQTQDLESKCMTRAQLNLVDLAGSEKVNKTGAVGETLEEAKKISFGLSCLGNVIRALTSGSSHVPYRDSKLTRLLGESLKGNCRTALIVTCSLDPSSVEETIGTLRFAASAKRVETSIKPNIRLSPEGLEQVIRLLKSQLSEANKKLSFYEKKGLADWSFENNIDVGRTVRDTSIKQTKRNIDQRTNVSKAKERNGPSKRQEGNHLKEIESLRKQNQQLRQQISRLKSLSGIKEYLDVKVRNYEQQVIRLKTLNEQIQSIISNLILGSNSTLSRRHTENGYLQGDDSINRIFKMLPQNLSPIFQNLHEKLMKRIAGSDDGVAQTLEITALQICINQHLLTPANQYIINLQDAILQNLLQMRVAASEDFKLSNAEKEIQKMRNQKISAYMQGQQYRWKELQSLIKELKHKIQSQVNRNSIIQRQVPLGIGSPRGSSQSRQVLEKSQRQNPMFRFNSLTFRQV